MIKKPLKQSNSVTKQPVTNGASKQSGTNKNSKQKEQAESSVKPNSEISHYKTLQIKQYQLLYQKLEDHDKRAVNDIYSGFLPKICNIREGNPKKGIKNSIENVLQSKKDEFQSVRTLNFTFLHKLERKIDPKVFHEQLDLLTIHSESFKNVKIFNLNLSQNQLQEAGGIFIGKVLSNMPNLEELNMLIDDNEFGKEGSIGLAQGFSQLKKLKSLNMKLSWNGIGPASMEAIGNSMENMKQLESLIINLWTNKIKDKGLAVFSKSLQKLQSLKILNLNLMKNEIGREGVEKLADCLSNLKNLQKLNLNLTQNLEELEDADKELLKDSCEYIKPKFNVVYV